MVGDKQEPPKAGAKSGKAASSASSASGAVKSGPVKYLDRCVQVDVCAGKDAAEYTHLKMELQVALSAAARYANGDVISITGGGDKKDESL